MTQARSVVVKNTRDLYKKVFIWELALIVIVGIVLFLFDKRLSYILILGSLVAFIPQQLVVFFLFFNKKYRNAKQNVKLLYLSEVIKISVTILLFILVFYFVNFTSPIYFLLGFISTVFLNNLLPLLVKNKVE